MQQKNTSIKYLAFHDPLTGLPNRLSLDAHMIEVLGSEEPTEKQTGILFIDLDDFKTINDSLGHQAGDELLVHVAACLRASVRKDDLVARFGGDEFVVVLNDIREGDTERVADNILRSLEKTTNIAERHITVSACIGVAAAPRDGTSPEELLRNADNALYRAKEAGSGSVRVFNPSMYLHSLANFLMQESLNKAVVKNEFFLEYQPIRSIAGNRIVSVEALIRWRHPMNVIAMPQEFMPLAEEVGLMEDIGQWRIKTILEQVAAWRSENIPIPMIAFNLSHWELKRKHAVPDLLLAFKEAKADPKDFQIEISEAQSVIEYENITSKLEELHSAGFRFAADHFGANHFPLTQLRDLPFKDLKIDRNLAHETTADTKGLSFLKSIIKLGLTLDLGVCIDGVDSAAQYESLLNSGCTSMQGNYISPPLSPADLADLLKREKSMLATVARSGSARNRK